MTKKLYSVSCLALTMCLAGPAAAQTSSNSQTSPAATEVPSPSDTSTSSSATVQEAASVDDSDIIVTGSRIARAGYDASTPVAISTEQDIRLSGQVNVERALLELPQVIGGAGAFSNAVTGTGGGYAELNLRGFGANRNLILVNGRRFAIVNASQITDTNTIPAALIKRTEIVTGGSSAVYGSDAITGVVNFILNDKFDGIEGRYQLNMIEHTFTPTYNVDLTVGKNFAGGRGNIAVALNYLNRKGNLRDDFDWSRYSFTLGESCVVAGTGSATQPGTRLTVPSGQTCQQAGGITGFVFTGSNDIPNSRIFGLPAFGTSAALDAAYRAAGLTGLTSNGFTFNDAGTAARLYIPAEDAYNSTPPNNLQFPQERYMANAFAHYDFSDAAKLYGEFHYSHNKVAGQIAPANYNAPTLLNVNNPYLTPQLQAVLRQLDLRETGTQTVIHGSTAFTTTPGDGLAVVSLGRRFSDIAERASINERDVYRGAIGLRGSLGEVTSSFLTGLNYDVYYTYSRATEDIRVVNGISKSNLQRSLLSVNGAPPVCNEFGQNLSDACKAAITVGALARNKAELQVAQANLTGTLFSLPAGPLGFSVGAEWRRTTAAFLPDQNLATGDVAGYVAGLPTSGAVTAKEIFGEVRIPLIHDTPLIAALTANAGFRGSDYSLSGVGTVWTYFYGADWRVTRDITFRGQYQRAIRAPSVGELYSGASTFSATLIDPCSSRSATTLQTADVRALCIATGVPSANVFTQAVQPAAFIYAQSGGNPNLSPEKADTYTAGVVLTPSFIPRLNVSIDYYDINLVGAIASLGGNAQNVFNLCYYTVRDVSSEYCSAIRRSAVTGEILESNPARILNANTGALKSRGIDFALNYRLPLTIGGLPNTSIDFRSNFTRLLEYTSTPVQALPAIRNKCVGTFGAICGEPKPEVRGSSRVTFNIGEVSLSARHRYIGPVTIDRYLVPLRQGSASTPTLDSIAYPRIGAQNYFDLSAEAAVAGNMRFYGGINNLTNRDMPAANNGISTYDPVGREIFIGISARY